MAPLNRNLQTRHQQWLKGALTTLVAIAVGFALAVQPAHAQSGATAQRKSVSNLTVAELMSLRRGVAQMMARNSAPHGSADYRRSWVYWANAKAAFPD